MKTMLCLTVRIKTRSIRFFKTAKSSSAEIFPAPIVNPLIKILFHSCSGAARDKQCLIIETCYVSVVGDKRRDSINLE